MLGRRGVLAGAVGLAALSACDVDDLRPPEDRSEPTPTPSVSITAEPDGDTVLAESVYVAIATAFTVVDTAKRTYPRLRTRLRAVALMHQAHLDVLEAPSEVSIPAAPPTTSPSDALTQVRAREQTLQRTLVSAAVQADSGALARLLASMSASVSQHTAVLR